MTGLTASCLLLYFLHQRSSHQPSYCMYTILPFEGRFGDKILVFQKQHNFIPFFKLHVHHLQDKSGKMVSGFKKSISSTAHGCLLKLKSEDQDLLKKHSFKNGRFTWVTESNREEGRIVASCGNFILKWNFRYGLQLHGLANGMTSDW